MVQAFCFLSIYRKLKYYGHSFLMGIFNGITLLFLVFATISVLHNKWLPFKINELSKTDRLPLLTSICFFKITLKKSLQLRIFRLILHLFDGHLFEQQGKRKTMVLFVDVYINLVKNFSLSSLNS